ncbi:MAG TPA: transcriptional regulator, partial [Polyangiaceae bacterium]|nr:transcriptional regulator [Polyangiaceae bacterium]
MKTLTFGPFRLVPRTRTLLEEGVPVPISGRAYDILVALVERAGETLSKEQLLSIVWPDTAVDETNVRVHIATLRKVLKGREGGYVASIPQKGYCFVAPVTQEESDADGPVPVARANRSQLPSLLTRVIGREDTVLALKQQVRAKRFVTVAGPAGIG